jgi:hypothetical protein
MLAWVVGCMAAGYWQISRAVAGNPLSYLYAVEWPVFAIGGVIGWWLLLHSAPVTAEEREHRRAFEARQRQTAQAAKRRPEEEDEALRAYNDHLAELAESDRREQQGE